MRKSVVRFIFTLFTTLFAATAIAQSQCPHSGLFESEVEAVVAAMDSFNPASIEEDREYMGTIYRQDGQFGYSVSAGTRHRDRVSIRVAKQDWDNVAALWHTHGDAQPSHRYFSDSDTHLVNRFRKPLYLGDYTGYLKKFSPGDRRLSPFAARRLGLPSRSGYAIGEMLRDSNGRLIRVKTRADRFR